MPFAEPWYLQTRAQAYAILRLTRGGVHVSRTPGMPGLDLLITAGGRGSALRHCGVVLQPRLATADPAVVEPGMIAREQRLFAESTLPICMLSFPAEDPNDDPTGEFRWVVEPRVQGGKAFLAFSSSRRFQPLTDELLRRLVQELGEWYALRSRDDQLLAAGVHDIAAQAANGRKRRAG